MVKEHKKEDSKELKEPKQKYELASLAEYVNKLGKVNPESRGWDTNKKLTCALNLMLQGKKIIATVDWKGQGYFVLEEDAT